ncbi:MAG TPA: ATP-binding protein [Burkholderiales bacterium]|jgi:PAS domain S-box-containing protein|nr:ATP-binding protein [Burkholderiales bacterium]
MSDQRQPDALPAQDAFAALRRRRRNFRLALWIVGSLVIVATATVQVFDVFRRLEIVIETTQGNYAGLVRMLSEQAGEALQLVDVVLRDTALEQSSAGALGGRALHDRLRDRVLALPQIDDVIVIDAAGQAISGADEYPVRGRGLAQEDFFLAHRGGKAELHVSTSPAGAAKHSIALSRRIESRDGRFAGVVVAFLDLDYFRRFYSAISLEAQAEVRLMRADGEALVRYPGARGAGDQAVFAGLMRDQQASTALLPGEGGEEHIYAVRRLDAYPFALGASVPRPAVLLPWHTQVLHSAVRTTLLCLSVALLMWLVLRELDQRERTERSLQIQTALLDELFDSAPEAIVMLDQQQRVTRVNREFTSMFGFPADGVVGTVLDDVLVPADLREESARMARAANRGQRAGGETERLRSDGSRLPVSVLVAPIMTPSGRIATYAIYRDISERRFAETERARLEHRLRHAEKLEAIGTMAGGIAHDFNNILSAILGYGDMAFNAAPEGGPLKRYVANVMSASHRARALVDQILSYGRSTRGRHEVVNAAAALEETLELVRASLPRNIELAPRIEVREAPVVADPTHVHQIAMNLCANAIHAMDAGGVLSVWLAETASGEAVRLSHGELPPGRYVVLGVRDSGRGIDAPVLERIFEPFFTTKASGTGTGLGLAMVQSIVNELGGAIDVRSEIGRGSEFRIYLPRSEAAAIAKGEDQPLPRGAGERVLVVEDERPVMLLTEEMLAALNYEPAGFLRAGDALRELRADPARFDAAVVDHLMPDMTGTDLIRQLHAIRPGLPIVLVSAYSGPVLSQEAAAAGVDQILSKPLDFRRLAQAMAEALSRATART